MTIYQNKDLTNILTASNMDKQDFTNTFTASNMDKQDLTNILTASNMDKDKQDLNNILTASNDEAWNDFLKGLPRFDEEYKSDTDGPLYSCQDYSVLDEAYIHTCKGINCKGGYWAHHSGHDWEPVSIEGYAGKELIPIKMILQPKTSPSHAAGLARVPHDTDHTDDRNTNESSDTHPATSTIEQSRNNQSTEPGRSYNTNPPAQSPDHSDPTTRDTHSPI